MRDRRSRKTRGVFAGVRRGLFEAENTADAWPSFAAVERAMSDRLRGDVMALDAVSFQQISRILEVTDGLGLNREWVEIPLSPECPGLVRRLENGKLEIIVDAEQPFEEWLSLLPTHIQKAQTT